MRRNVVAACLIGLALGAVGGDAPAQAADWPQWRGPQRDGVSTEEGSLGDLTRPLERAWERFIGVGYSSVAVRDGRLYTMGWADEQDTVWCLNASNGELVWKHAYPAQRHNDSHEGGPAATPAVNDRHVFTQSRDGRVLCLDAATGKPVWERDLRKEMGVRPPNWTFAGSPLLLEDAVIFDVGKTVALNPASGETIWETADYGAAYSSPVAFETGGKRRIAVFNGAGLVVLDGADGKEIARHGWETQYGVNAATPVVLDDHILITSGYNHGAALLKLAGDKLEPVWESRELRSQMASPVVLGEQIYGFDERVLKCLDLRSGQERWAERGLGAGTLVGADGKLVILSERGELVIAEATPEGFQAVARAQAIDNESRCWTAPVAVGGRIYCRGNQGQLVCLQTAGS